MASTLNFSRLLMPVKIDRTVTILLIPNYFSIDESDLVEAIQLDLIVVNVTAGGKVKM